jgi:putative transposase
LRVLNNKPCHAARPNCRARFTEQQIAFAQKQAELGTPIEEVCRKMGISDETFYVSKKKYGELGTSESRRLRQLEEENSKLKWVVAGLSLDNGSEYTDPGASFRNSFLRFLNPASCRNVIVAFFLS